jgi:[acyl-carrier-protein] S-malonyltransferase
VILTAQICNSVRWTETVQYLAENGVTHLLEIGPGKVLRTLTPKITSEIQAISLEKVEQLETVRSLLSGEASK